MSSETEDPESGTTKKPEIPLRAGLLAGAKLAWDTYKFLFYAPFQQVLSEPDEFFLVVDIIDESVISFGDKLPGELGELVSAGVLFTPPTTIKNAFVSLLCLDPPVFRAAFASGDEAPILPKPNDWVLVDIYGFFDSDGSKSIKEFAVESVFTTLPEMQSGIRVLINHFTEIHTVGDPAYSHLKLTPPPPPNRDGNIEADADIQVSDEGSQDSDDNDSMDDDKEDDEATADGDKSKASPKKKATKKAAKKATKKTAKPKPSKVDLPSKVGTRTAARAKKSVGLSETTTFEIKQPLTTAKKDPVKKPAPPSKPLAKPPGKTPAPKRKLPSASDTDEPALPGAMVTQRAIPRGSAAGNFQEEGLTYVQQDKNLDYIRTAADMVMTFAERYHHGKQPSR